MSDLSRERLLQIELAAYDLLAAYGVVAPPVPVEEILQRPLDDLWEEVDLSMVSGNFMSMSDPFAPRMSLARTLARHLLNSRWGEVNGLAELSMNGAAIHALARAIVMPRGMIALLAPGSRSASAVSDHFEVPLSDAQKRLAEVALP